MKLLQLLTKPKRKRRRRRVTRRLRLEQLEHRQLMAADMLGLHVVPDDANSASELDLPAEQVIDQTLRAAAVPAVKGTQSNEQTRQTSRQVARSVAELGVSFHDPDDSSSIDPLRVVQLYVRSSSEFTTLPGTDSILDSAADVSIESSSVGSEEKIDLIQEYAAENDLFSVDNGSIDFLGGLGVNNIDLSDPLEFNMNGVIVVDEDTSASIDERFEELSPEHVAGELEYLTGPPVVVQDGSTARGFNEAYLPSITSEDSAHSIFEFVFGNRPILVRVD